LVSHILEVTQAEAFENKVLRKTYGPMRDNRETVKDYIMRSFMM
jgi:hypothetical protein